MYVSAWLYIFQCGLFWSGSHILLPTLLAPRRVEEPMQAESVGRDGEWPSLTVIHTLSHIFKSLISRRLLKLQLAHCKAINTLPEWIQTFPESYRVEQSWFWLPACSLCPEDDNVSLGSSTAQNRMWDILKTKDLYAGLLRQHNKIPQSAWFK